MKRKITKKLMNHEKGNYEELQKYFKVEWKQELERDVDIQHMKFCKIYEVGVLQHIPHQREKVKCFSNHSAKDTHQKKKTYNGYNIRGTAMNMHVRGIKRQENNTSGS